MTVCICSGEGLGTRTGHWPRATPHSSGWDAGRGGTATAGAATRRAGAPAPGLAPRQAPNTAMGSAL